MDIDLPIFNGVEEVFDVILVSQGSPVGLEPAVNFHLLFGSQKFGTDSDVSYLLLRYS